MRLGYFTMPVHPKGRDWSQTLREDREAVILADRLGFYDAFVGEHLTDLCENITNSMMFHATLIHDDQADQACHRHHQPLAHAPGADRRACGDVRPSGAGPLHLGRLRRRAHLGRRGAGHSRRGPQQNLRRGNRRDPGDLGARAALQNRFPRQPLQGDDRARRRASSRRRLHGQAVAEAAAGNRRHGGGAVLARRGADGQARLPSAVGELPSGQASQVALEQLRQGQGRGRRRRPRSPTGGWRARSSSPTTTRRRRATGAKMPTAPIDFISSRCAPR